MELQHHEAPDLGLTFDHPGSWRVERGDTFQIINQNAPHGAITISLLMSGPLGGAPSARLSFADRTTQGTPPAMIVDSWTFVCSGCAGMVSYCHDAQDGREAREAAMIINSLVIRAAAPVPPPPRRGWLSRLFGAR
jgi:hypothetical protein